MFARLSAFASWALVAGSVMYWALRLFAGATTAPDYTVAVEQTTRGDVARVFGASVAPAAPVAAVAAPAPQASSRFKLVGVAAPQNANVAGGLALISVDGKAPRAISVGRTVDDGWILQSVSRRGARLSSGLGAETVDLDAPTLPTASRGVPGGVPGGTSFSPGAQPAPSIGTPVVRPPVALPSAAPIAPPGFSGAPPAVFVPPEELNRARARAAGAAED